MKKKVLILMTIVLIALLVLSIFNKEDSEWFPAEIDDMRGGVLA